MGQSPPSSTYNEEGKGLPFFQGVKDFGRIYPSKRVYCTANTRKIAEADDVLLSVRAPVGEVNIASERCIIGRGVAALRVKTRNKNDQRFLYYLMLFNQKFWRQIHSGTTFEEITSEDIENLEVFIPENILERHKIAEILGSLDDKIELNYEMNKTLETIAQAIFKNWFVDFEPFKDELVYSEELGKEIPRGWEVVKLGDLVDLKKGLSYRSEDLREKSEVGLVNLNCIARGGGFQDEIKPYSGKFESDHIVQTGDVVVAITDLTRNREIIGMPARIYPVEDFKTLVASLDLVILKPKDEKRLKQSFLYYLLLTRDYWGYVNGCADGTTVLHLKPGDILNYKLTLPPQDWQARFAKVADSIFELLIHNFRESYILEKIRDTLLPKLLSGGIRVKVDVEKGLSEEAKKLEKIREEKAKFRASLDRWFK
jgi:type I restriction enzyme S subunit